MEPEKQEDLFDIRLKEVGRNYILKTSKIAGGVLVIGILSAVATFAATGFRVYKFVTRSYEFYTRSIFFGDILTMILMVVNVFAITKYWSFVINLRNSIADTNEVQFNQSFKYLYNHILLMMTAVVLSILTLLMFYLGLAI